MRRGGDWKGRGRGVEGLSGREVEESEGGGERAEVEGCVTGVRKVTVLGWWLGGVSIWRVVVISR